MREMARSRPEVTVLLFVKFSCASFSLHNVADETAELKLCMSLRDP